MANAWGRYMERVKESNAKVKADHNRSIAKIKQEEQRDKPTGNKFMMILWGTILSAPLFVIGIILFAMAALLFWDAIFGL